MKTFPVNSIGAAAIFTILAMGVIGGLVVYPVVFINWSWNSVVPMCSFLPPINLWQSLLLYVAAATALFLSGIIQIEVDAESLD